MKQVKNFLVITGLLLMDIAIGFQCGAVQAKANEGLEVTNIVDIIFANLSMTVIDVSIFIFGVMFLISSTLIITKKENKKMKAEFDEKKIKKLPLFCKKTYRTYARDIEKYDFDDFGIYTAKNILYNAITNQSQMSFMVAINKGLSSYVNGLSNDKNKTNMKLLCSDWVLKHGRQRVK